MEGQGDLRPVPSVLNKAPRRFYVVEPWMYALGLGRAEVQTYACVISFVRAHLRTGAPDIAEAVGRGERTVRRHLSAIEAAGLWVVQRRGQLRGTTYMQGANSYLPLWHPAMGEALRGESYRGGHRMRVIREQPPRDVARHVRDTGIRELAVVPGASSLTATSPLLMNAENNCKQAGISALDTRHAVSTDLRRELDQLSPHVAADCFRVLDERLGGHEPELAKRAAALAVRKLVARVRQGNVANPAGLLRARLVDEAIDEVTEASGDHGEGAAELARLSEAVLATPSAFVAVQRMRERYNVARTVHEHREDAATWAPSPPGEPELAEVFGEVAKLLRCERAAIRRDDGEAKSAIGEQLIKLEPRLVQLLRKHQGRTP
jgi:DNA-binding transcriptional ArsR family regulator